MSLSVNLTSRNQRAADVTVPRDLPPSRVIYVFTYVACGLNSCHFAAVQSAVAYTVQRRRCGISSSGLRLGPCLLEIRVSLTHANRFRLSLDPLYSMTVVYQSPQARLRLATGEKVHYCIVDDCYTAYGNKIK